MAGSFLQFVLIGDRIRVWYLIYQLLSCMFLLGCVLKTWIDASEKNSSWKYIIWMTHWGIVSINFCVFIETCLTFYIYLKISRADKPSEKLNRKSDENFLYWSLLFNWGTETLSFENFYVHAIQGIYSIIDQFMSARPWDGGHWWLSLPFPVIYACFNVIYWAAGGTDYYGNSYIYDILDWSNDPGMAVAYLAAALVCIIAVHYLFVFITWIRDRLHTKFF